MMNERKFKGDVRDFLGESLTKKMTEWMTREKNEMNERKKERKKERKEGEIWEKEKIWVCVKWTPRFSKVHSRLQV
jgi:hypothetical protein